MEVVLDQCLCCNRALLFDSLSLSQRASPPHLAKDGLGPTTVNAQGGLHRRPTLAPARKRPAAEWFRRREKTAQREAVTTGPPSFPRGPPRQLVSERTLARPGARRIATPTRETRPSADSRDRAARAATDPRQHRRFTVGGIGRPGRYATFDRARSARRSGNSVSVTLTSSDRRKHDPQQTARAGRGDGGGWFWQQRQCERTAGAQRIAG